VELKARYDCALVGATLGKRGAILYCEDQFLVSPASRSPAACRDTTGREMLFTPDSFTGC